jgi:hypothetical protein
VEIVFVNEPGGPAAVGVMGFALQRVWEAARVLLAAGGWIGLEEEGDRLEQALLGVMHLLGR